MEYWVVIVVGGVIAGFVQGLSGFGFGLASLAIWSWVLEPEAAVPTVVFGSLVGQLLATGSLRQHMDIARAGPFLIGGVLGIPLGLWLLSLIDPLLFKFGLGALLFVYCFIMLFIKHIHKISWGGRFADGVAGWIGGVAGGVGGIPGALPTLWCSLRGWQKDQQRSVFQMFNLLMHIITFASFVLLGLIQPQTVKIIAVVTPCIILPTLLGLRMYQHFSDKTFRLIVLSLLLSSSITLLIATAPQVLAKLL